MNRHGALRLPFSLTEKFKTLLSVVPHSRRMNAANGQCTTNRIPQGSTSITPHIVVTPARNAIEFYRDTFGATAVDVMEMGEGLIAHAEFEFAAGKLTLSGPMDDYGLQPIDPDRTTYSLALYVPDVDAVLARAETAGATVREPASTFASGDRFASIIDPFSVRWTIMTRVEDLSPEESRRRVAEWGASI